MTPQIKPLVSGSDLEIENVADVTPLFDLMTKDSQLAIKPHILKDAEKKLHGLNHST